MSEVDESLKASLKQFTTIGQNQYVLAMEIFNHCQRLGFVTVTTTLSDVLQNRQFMGLLSKYMAEGLCDNVETSTFNISNKGEWNGRIPIDDWNLFHNCRNANLSLKFFQKKKLTELSHVDSAIKVF
jgi:hypothetical protein